MARLPASLITSLLLASTLGLSRPAITQAEPDSADSLSGVTTVVVTAPPPVTKIEKLLDRKGEMLITAYTVAGAVPGEKGTSIRLLSVEVKIAGGTERETGIAIEVHSGDRTVVSYLDSDELERVARALTELSRLDSSASTMENVEAHFRTRGNIQFANRNLNGVRTLTIANVQTNSTTGEMTWSTACFNIGAIGQLMEQFAAATSKLPK